MKKTFQIHNRKKRLIFISLFIIFFTILLSFFGVFNSLFTQKNNAFDNFNKQYWKLYGYDGKIDSLRDTELQPRLGNDIYLDYTASGLYQNSQISKTHKLLTSSIFSNVHGTSKSSLATEEKVNSIRDLILKFFNTDSSKYALIFTSGATASLETIGNFIDWNENSNFFYLRKNHNSVLGIREIMKNFGGNYSSIDEKKMENLYFSFSNTYPKNALNPIINLFAFPAQENFAGKIYPLEWINSIQNGIFDSYIHNNERSKWLVLLDAAAYVPTHHLNLSLFSPDFVVLSFYKMFGYPTGLGVLLIKQDIVRYLRKIYFGGGTVHYTLCDTSWQIFDKNPCKRFEDGTINFLDIMSLEYGFEALQEVGGINQITKHVNSLTEYLSNKLKNLKHKSTNTPVVVLYGNHGNHQNNNHENNHILNQYQGSIVTFNIINPKGEYEKMSHFQQLAIQNNIHVRVGCTCNPGACYDYIGFACDEIKKYVLENMDLCMNSEVDFLNGKPLGAIRVSIGYLTSFDDISNFIDFVIKNFRK